jgi:hypothetical protein
MRAVCAARDGQRRRMNIRFNHLILMVILLPAATPLASCGTQNIEQALTQEAPLDCRLPAKLFDWFSLQVKTASWSKDAGPGEDGTATIVVTIQNTDFVPHALSNSGGGYLYSVEMSLKGDDGAVYAVTDASGIAAANNSHSPIRRDRAEEGTLKFRVRRGNYALILGRKFDGKPVVKYDFACTMALS